MIDPWTDRADPIFVTEATEALEPANKEFRQDIELRVAEPRAEKLDPSVCLSLIEHPKPPAIVLFTLRAAPHKESPPVLATLPNFTCLLTEADP